MATNPKFAATARIGVGALSAANTNRDGTGTIVDIITGVSAGTRIEEIVVEATAITTAGMVRIYVYDGSTRSMFDEFVVTAVPSVAAGIPTYRERRTYTNLVLPSASWKVQASTHNAETFNVVALGGDLT